MTRNIAASLEQPWWVGHGHRREGYESPQRPLGVRDSAKVVQPLLFEAPGQDPHQRWLVNHGAKQATPMVGQQFQGDDRAGTAAEDICPIDPVVVKHCGDIGRLLCNADRSGHVVERTTGVPAPVEGDHGEPLGQQPADAGIHLRVAATARNEYQRRPVSGLLGMQPGAGGPDQIRGRCRRHSKPLTRRSKSLSTV
jgi:hypothetical protein